MSKSERLKSYLEQQVNNGKYYFKSREVANDLQELSPKQIGTLFRELSEDDELQVEQWNSGSKAVTWYVSPR